MDNQYNLKWEDINITTPKSNMIKKNKNKIIETDNKNNLDQVLIKEMKEIGLPDSFIFGIINKLSTDDKTGITRKHIQVILRTAYSAGAMGLAG